MEVFSSIYETIQRELLTTIGKNVLEHMQKPHTSGDRNLLLKNNSVGKNQGPESRGILSHW